MNELNCSCSPCSLFAAVYNKGTLYSYAMFGGRAGHGMVYNAQQNGFYVFGEFSVPFAFVWLLFGQAATVLARR